MFEKVFGSAWRVQQLRDSPAGSRLESFAGQLWDAGYDGTVVRKHVRSAEHLACWAKRRDFALEDLDQAGIRSFERHLRRCRCLHFDRTYPVDRQQGVGLFLKYLHEAGEIKDSWKQTAAAEPELLIAFQDWMQQQRGTSISSLQTYSYSIRDLLRTVGDDPRRFDARNLRQFVLKRSQQTGPGATRSCVSGVRMFLRFLIAEGRCSPGLDGSIPVIACWRLSALPRYLQEGDVERVIASCDRTTPVGRRDRAVLLLLARMGLRAGGVAHLKLNDIDWGNAWLQVSGKNRSQTRLPLTQEVGDAVADYLQHGRPPTQSETLFVRSRAPFQALKSHSGISMTVVRTMHRAGVKCPGRGAAHILRHSAATSMLRHGTSLQEIGLILRHRSIKTTEIYAKIDVNALSTIAQSWPEVTPC
jgi:site-specific recombinase XerD